MGNTNQFMALPNFKFCPSRVRRRDEKNNSSVYLLAVRGEGACARGFRLFSCAEIALYYTALDIYIYTADGPSLGARARLLTLPGGYFLGAFFFLGAAFFVTFLKRTFGSSKFTFESHSSPRCPFSSRNRNLKRRAFETFSSSASAFFLC